MAESKLPSMVAQLEESITKHFYAKDAAAHRRLCYAVGLQTPLWLWTHEEQAAGSGRAMNGHTALHESKDVRKVCHLMEWFVHNQVDLSSVAVMVPFSQRELFKSALITCLGRWMKEQGTGTAPSATPQPHVLAHHELGAMNRRDKTTYTFDVVVYVLGVRPDMAAIPMAVSQGDFISEALGAARRSFVMLADSAWTGPFFTAKWTQWKNFVAKLQEEQPPISAVPDDDPSAVTEDATPCLPSLVGNSLPLCCARHPNQRQLAYGLTTIPAECKRLCLRHYDCGVEVHLCRDACHPHQRHSGCPFSCGRTLPCGHECLLTCSSRCNCFEVVERPLTCSHQLVLGLDPETLEPIYGTVQHVFKGVCADAALPCAVEFTTECVRCLGPLTVKCFEAQAQQHTCQNRTLLCDACKRTERELRAQILGEVLFGAEAEKKRLKVELQRALHQQRKAAAQGLFTPGVKVEVVDATKCVPPLLADEDFPGVPFVDMDDPNFYTSMEGAYGTFISSHVDVMDRAELRNLMRLPDGKHVLVTDGGLRMIRALTTGVTGASARAALMLTAKPHGDQAGSAAEREGGNAPEFDRAKGLVGATCYLSEPVPCGECEEGMVSDKVVTVVAVDPSSAEDVVVECRVLRRRPDADPSKTGQQEEGDPTPKRQRLEEGGAATPTGTHEAALLRFSAPISALEPMAGYERGQYVYVVNPERQVTDPHAMADLQSAVDDLLAAQPHAAGPLAKLTGAPVNPDLAYELLGIVNPPLWIDSGAEERPEDDGAGERPDSAETAARRLGPCAILRPRGTAGVAAAAARVGGRRGAAPRATPAAAQTERPLVAVPFMFTSPDELTEAENALDAAAQQRFEQRLRDAISAHSEELSLRHEEEAFHAQQQMGEVTAARLAEERVAFSVPVPLPSAEHMAAVRRRHLKLPVGTPVTARIARAKDALAAKAEVKELPAWLEAMRSRFALDRETGASHIRSVQSEQQQLQRQSQHVRHNPQPPAPHHARHRR